MPLLDVSLPPPEVMLDVLLHVLLPAAVAAGVLTAAAELLGGSKWAPVGAALGLAVGVTFVQWQRESLTLITGDSAWNRLPWAAGAALLLGLALRLPAIPPVVGWPLRAAVAAGAAWWVIPAESRTEVEWLAPAFAAVVLAEWLLLEYLARRPPGGSVPLILGLAFFAAATVLIHAGSAKLTEVALASSAALGGVALVTWWRHADGGGAVPGAAVLLPGLLLVGQQETFSEVAWQAFVLPAVAPLALALTLPLPGWQGTRLRLLRLVLVLGPLAVAVALALEAGPLEFE